MKYPKYKQSIYDSSVVLFLAPNFGILVTESSSGYSTKGEISSGWAEEESFADCEAPVITELSNADFHIEECHEDIKTVVTFNSQE